MAIKKFPSVLSFQRLATITDALFEDEVGGVRQPLYVVEHGIMGTQNVSGGKKNERKKDEKGGEEDSGAKVDSANRDPRNPHWIESAKTRAESDATIVSFSLRGVDLKNALFSCASTVPGGGKEMRLMVDAFIDKVKPSAALDEIALRYARNIANARWLFRNRTVAAKIAVQNAQTRPRPPMRPSSPIVASKAHS